MKRFLIVGMLLLAACKPTPSVGGGTDSTVVGGGSGDTGGNDPACLTPPCAPGNQPKTSVGTDSVTVVVDTVK